MEFLRLGSYGTVPSEFFEILWKSFANSVARYTSRSYHFQRGSDLSGRTSHFEIINEICYYENVNSHYLYSRHKKSDFEAENVKYENILKNQHSKLTKSKVRYFKFIFQKLTKTNIQNKSAKKKSS